MDRQDIEETLRKVAEELCDEGPGSALESVALRETAKRLGVGDDVKAHQAILNCWQTLFLNQELFWGYDLNNPSAPFFHIAEPAAVRN